MRVSSVTRQSPVTLTFDIDGEPMTVTFDRNQVTPAWFARSRDGIEATDPMTTPRALADVIITWDVTADDGAAYAPTVENMAVIPIPVLDELLSRMLEAAVPSRAEGNASSVRSSTPPSASTAPPPTSPNGAATSTSPVPSASPSPT